MPDGYWDWVWWPGLWFPIPVWIVIGGGGGCGPFCDENK